MHSKKIDAEERINDWVLRAHSRGASDLHVEPLSASLRVRARVDGDLSRVDEIGEVNTAAVLARLKIMARLDVNERRVPQDGRIHFRDFCNSPEAKGLDLRINISPCLFGEKAVLRLIDNRKLKFRLEDLGYAPDALERYRECIHRPHGLTLHVGPTGSGKTTSLYAALAEIDSPRRNLVTVEDPIEYTREGYCQTQVNPDVGLSFPVVLRALLRQDPDVIMIGEIRDLETADIACEAAMTGHRVFSTLHTNDALGTVARLKDMGVPDFQISTALQCVVSQRFVRKLCPNCRQLERVDDLEKKLRAQFYRAGGCRSCDMDGYTGRLAVMEVMSVDARVRQAIGKGERAKVLRRAARDAGMKTIYEDALMKAAKGLTSLAEVLRVTKGVQVSDRPMGQDIGEMVLKQVEEEKRSRELTRKITDTERLKKLRAEALKSGIFNEGPVKRKPRPPGEKRVAESKGRPPADPPSVSRPRPAEPASGQPRRPRPEAPSSGSVRRPKPEVGPRRIPSPDSGKRKRPPNSGRVRKP